MPKFLNFIVFICESSDLNIFFLGKAPYHLAPERRWYTPPDESSTANTLISVQAVRVTLSDLFLYVFFLDCIFYDRLLSQTYYPPTDL